MYENLNVFVVSCHLTCVQSLKSKLETTSTKLRSIICWAREFCLVQCFAKGGSFTSPQQAARWCLVFMIGGYVEWIVRLEKVSIPLSCYARSWSLVACLLGRRWGLAGAKDIFFFLLALVPDQTENSDQLFSTYLFLFIVLFSCVLKKKKIVYG